MSCFNKKFQKHLFADVLQNRVLKFFVKFLETDLCWSLFLIKLQPSGLEFLKKRLQHRCFPVNFVKYLRTPFLQNTSERLLLKFVEYLFLESLFVSLDNSQNFICLKEQEFCFVTICVESLVYCMF